MYEVFTALKNKFYTFPTYFTTTFYAEARGGVSSESHSAPLAVPSFELLVELVDRLLVGGDFFFLFVALLLELFMALC